MSPVLGDSIGHYRITGRLGEGGMGEVYRATDSKLGRDVAIKVLPAAFADDPDRMARFEREAKVLASLNHPNIAAIYGIEERAIVMEMVHGETLKGPLPLDTALNYASQIGSALEAAHEKGVIHRDLKPANIMVTPDGVIKVLDFGLAAVALGPDPNNSPTLTMSPTRAGIILGTAGYMSPEQARGRPVDKRADIWAFGVVLYEMLTGKQLFGGETVSDTLAAVLTKTPDLERVPVQVRRLLAQCLEKDPKRRLRDIGDARPLLDSAPETARVRPWQWIAATAILTLAVPAAWFLKPKPAQPDQPLLQMEIAAPVGTTFGPVVPGQLALSPDGRRLAFVATGKDRKRMLWMRLLAANSAAALPGTESAVAPFWSPDSRWVAFSANGTLRKVEVAGGQPQLICSLNSGVMRGAWNSEGVILFSEDREPIQRVSASGGTPTPVLTLDSARAETEHRHPYFLPDGRHFLYLSIGKESGLAFSSLDGKTHRFLLANRNSPAYYARNPAGGGWLMYTVGGQLQARPFDAGKGEFTGEAEVVTDALHAGPSWSASENGFLAFRRMHGSQSQLTWFSRDGKRLGIAADPGDLSGPKISPDQKTIVFSRTDGRNSDLWLFDVARETTTRFSLGPNFNTSPVWSPDGSRIFYTSRRQNHGVVIERPANGIGPEKILKSLPENILRPSGVSRDGHWLVVSEIRPPNTRIVLLSLVDGKSLPFLDAGRAGHGSLSPDGRWILYSSAQADNYEVFVQSLPKEASGSPHAEGKFQISTAGGTFPVWRADGKEIFYLASDAKLMAVPIESGVNLFRPGAPKPLFQTNLNTDLLLDREYDVTPDGQRFIINQGTAEINDTPITVIVNWPKLLQK